MRTWRPKLHEIKKKDQCKITVDGVLSNKQTVAVSGVHRHSHCGCHGCPDTPRFWTSVSDTQLLAAKIVCKYDIVLAAANCQLLHDKATRENVVVKIEHFFLVKFHWRLRFCRIPKESKWDVKRK